jgi:hypothetical protein
MYARVATFEDAPPDKVREMADRMRAEDGPPPGLPAVGVLILHNAEGKAMGITLFDTEEDLEQGDSALGAMDPPVPGAMGHRTAVERFEVAVKLEG